MRSPDSDQDCDTAQDDTLQRLAALEQLLHQQQEEIERLRVALTLRDESQQLTLSGPVEAARAGRRPSRRSLLKLGGVTAAAGAAALAGNLAGGQVARAAGTPWTTGTVTADSETVVVPGSGYSSADMLQLRLGSGTPYNPLGAGGPPQAALAAYDTTGNGNVGAYGTSSSGYGLLGMTDTGTGAAGAGLSGKAASTGTGVYGSSQSGIGIQGNSATGIGGSFGGGQAPLALTPAGAAGPPTSGTHVKGEISIDSNGTVWICQQSGIFGGSPTPAFYPLSGIVMLPAPFRIIGGSSSYNGLPGVQINAAGESSSPIYSFSMDAKVPSFAKAVFGNATCHSMNVSGHLDLWPAGQSRPKASTVNYVPTDVPLSNFCIVGLGSSGAFARGISVASYTTCGFLFDLAGYVV